MNIVYRILWLFIGLNGAMFVGFSAYASHARRFIDYPQLLTIFESASNQHAIHLLALLALASISLLIRSRWLLVSAGLFTLGIVLFSFTLYLFSFTGVKIAGFLTPIGGVCFMLGWLSLIGIAWGEKQSTECLNE
tara:strand:- start:294 stop:698 length:405 start_codon:yes stop_codon:yes gene_type:complete